MRKPLIKEVSIQDTITILGVEVHGLRALRDAIECRSTVGSTFINGKGIEVICDEPYISFEKPKNPIHGLHVLEFYEPYPCFDSSDYAYEDRFYWNFFFSKTPFTKTEVRRLAFVKRYGGLEFIKHEMEEWMLPSIYFDGDNETMTYAF